MNDFNTAVLTDHDLLYGGVVDLVEENRASARRWARLVEIHRRQPPAEESALPGWGPMSAREWTSLEVSEVWALNDQHARSQLNIALFLSEHLPEVWALCLSGALDRYRAVTIADLLRKRLDTSGDWAKAGARVMRFLRKHLRSYAELNIDMVTCTITQLRNRLNYEIRVLTTDDEAFARSFADRKVTVHEAEPGIAQLSVTHTTDQVMLARHRLHLAAKAKRADGDQRTIDQLMSDLALDLIIGRGDDIAIPAYARPIVNVTVPLETLAGLRDDPGLLSGGAVIPADLARAIATSEGATWFRLLTDPDADPVSLSTKSYAPTTTIWRHVVATKPACVHDACDRPAVLYELDHQVPWPAGETSATNLDPLCRRHHKAKHARANRRARADLDWEYEMRAS